MPKYESQWFNSPAPIARVTLFNPDNELSVMSVPFLLDTGADISLIPQSVADKLEIVPSGTEYELEGFDGNKSSVLVAYLHLNFVGKKFKG